MDRIYVYSNRHFKLKLNSKSNFKIQEEKASSIYCNSILLTDNERERCSAQILDCIFFVIIDRIVAKKFGDDFESGIFELFSGKLTEYLLNTGIKRRIDHIIGRLLKDGNVIHIDGVITFRLKEFSQDISAFFDMLIYEYRVQKQYKDFICLVKDYIDVEKPREPVIHIVFRLKGFRLFDANGNDITDTALKKYKQDAKNWGGNYNDFLLSSLLDYIPKNIFIHNQHRAPNRRIVDTIETIFSGRVTKLQ